MNLVALIRERSEYRHSVPNCTLEEHHTYANSHPHHIELISAGSGGKDEN